MHDVSASVWMDVDAVCVCVLVHSLRRILDSRRIALSDWGQLRHGDLYDVSKNASACNNFGTLSSAGKFDGDITYVQRYFTEIW